MPANTLPSPPLAPIRCQHRRQLDMPGPRLIEMLADTDMCSVISAEQSGPQWATDLVGPDLFK